MSLPPPREHFKTDAEYDAARTAAAKAHEEMKKTVNRMTSTSATAKPASKSNLSVAKRAELTDAYKKSYAAATAKKPAPTLAATVKAKPLTAATTKPATSATAKPAASLAAMVKAKPVSAAMTKTATSATAKKPAASLAAMVKAKPVSAAMTKTAATVKKATGGYITKPTFKW